MPKQYSDTKVLMGTAVTLTVFDRSEAHAREAISHAFAEIARIDAAMSVHGPESELRKINEAAGRAPVAVDTELVGVLRSALEIAEASGGAFDPTLGGVSRLWGFERGGRVPDPEELSASRSGVGWRSVIISPDDGRVGLEKHGAELDLGGIAKGYAIDAAARSLLGDGVRSGMIDAGGDLRLIGGRPGKGFWRVGIQDPRDAGRLVAKLDLSDVAVATSGDYERFFVQDGVRYHHILDPATGMPARGCRSVTVIAPTAIEADACATAAFVLGPERGIAFLRSRQGVKGVIIDGSGELRWSDESLRNGVL